MPDPVHRGDLPPDVSPEYAEAYHRAYERAVGEEGVREAPEDAERTQRLDDLDALLAHASHEEYVGPSHRDVEAAERPGWVVPALLAGLVVLLLVGAYGVGSLFSSAVDSDATDREPSGVVMSEDGSGQATPTDDGKPSQDDKQPETDRPDATRYHGRTEAATIAGARASCQSPSSVDAAGNQIAYPPGNAYDGDLSTAWRCGGDGVGETLTLTLPQTVEVGQVGLVPGYAKTDPRSGVDRYAENNRITKVRWSFSDGTSLVQTLDGSAENRDLQTIATPLTEADQVTLEVLASSGGSRNTIAVSEVRIGAAAD